jgi:hypothetical protein
MEGVAPFPTTIVWSDIVLDNVTIIRVIDKPAQVFIRGLNPNVNDVMFAYSRATWSLILLVQKLSENQALNTD